MKDISPESLGQKRGCALHTAKCGKVREKEVGPQSPVGSLTDYNDYVLMREAIPPPTYCGSNGRNKVPLLRESGAITPPQPLSAVGPRGCEQASLSPPFLTCKLGKSKTCPDA